MTTRSRLSILPALLGLALFCLYAPSVEAAPESIGAPNATAMPDGMVVPNPPLPFGGTINLRAQDSTPWWPPQVMPPESAPNVLLIMTDDAGYGVSGTFGGVIPTPAMDALAAEGIRYTQFHSTALCSPSLGSS